MNRRDVEEIVSRGSEGRAAVFLDRDGVLNETVVVDGVPRPPGDAESLVLRPGVVEACHALRRAGLLLVVVSNQPDVARGRVAAAEVERITARLRALVPLDDVRICPHDDGDGCRCRKPADGLLHDAARDWGIDLGRSVVVGDRWRDVVAGRSAGCRTVLVRAGHGDGRGVEPDLVVDALLDAVPWILRTVSAAASGDTATLDPTRLRVKLFADGADLQGILALAALPYVRGFTTNPTLMRAAGIANYEAFAGELLQRVSSHPVSLEVFADDVAEMERQARRISSWGDNVYVKIPVTTSTGEPCTPLARRLGGDGVKVNLTAICTVEQVAKAVEALADGAPGYVSLFAGRIADTGRDPLPYVRAALDLMRPHPHLELIWASPREVLNVVQADTVGCHIITVTHELLKKLGVLGMDLATMSLETVRMFHRDATQAGFCL